ncbi:hypothetical protein HGRIS_013048 [Hohenbuehelia grisea]|uniref:Uncharacterized protein n=1 Tax=Hohenbuehelia grisea TaxID=104357 RepID=A0ABR3IUB0_9AGAR
MLVPMMTPRRLITLTVSAVISIHFLLGTVHNDYARFSSFQNLSHHFSALRNYTGDAWHPSPVVDDVLPPPRESSPIELPSLHNATLPHELLVRRANATLVMLCRNEDLAGVLTSVKGMEDRFNKKYKYPWVLLNEKPFTQEFKEHVSTLTDAPIYFGQIPNEHWYQPSWIDEKRAEQGRMRMSAQRIIYADSVPYRNMCRFNSGFFFHHELLKPYRYYWRVEPEVSYFCDIDYDPFLWMEDNDKVYGFTISLYEWEPTIPTLWSTVKEFMALHPEYIAEQNSMDFLSDNGGETYNLCHCAPDLSVTSKYVLTPLPLLCWQTGATLKFRTWTSGEAKPTKSFSISWNPRAGSTTSAGVMHPFTA